VNSGIDKQGLIDLLEPPLQALGYELVDLEARVGGDGMLRLFIDREPSVTLADCEFVSQQIGAFLDVEDPLPGRYVLEVSSPGTDRRLRTAAHFRRFVNAQVRVELKRPLDGRRRFKGLLGVIDDDTIAVELEGRSWRFRLDDIALARLVPED
jgi:ribosome maturation factor RimP